MPITSKPVTKRRKKSRFQASSGSNTLSVIMLVRKRLPIQSASRITNRAISDNQRKFAGPRSIQYTGNRTQTNIVQGIFIHAASIINEQFLRDKCLCVASTCGDYSVVACSAPSEPSTQSIVVTSIPSIILIVSRSSAWLSIPSY